MSVFIWSLPFDLSGMAGPASSYGTAGIARMYQYAIFLKLVWNKTKICNNAVPTGCLAINITVYVVNLLEPELFFLILARPVYKM